MSSDSRQKEETGGQLYTHHTSSTRCHLVLRVQLLEVEEVGHYVGYGQGQDPRFAAVVPEALGRRHHRSCGRKGSGGVMLVAWGSLLERSGSLWNVHVTDRSNKYRHKKTKENKLIFS